MSGKTCPVCGPTDWGHRRDCPYDRNYAEALAAPQEQPASGVSLGVPRLHASRVDALIAVLEGECDGLAVTRETAEAIMHYLDGNAPPEWKETALRLWDSSKGYYTEWSNDTPDVLRAEFVKLLFAAAGVKEDASAQPRALTQFELLHARDNHPVGMTPEESAIRKFCEVNGLTYGVPPADKPLSETGWPYNEKIQCAKRIMAAVDTYHAGPDDMNRTALRGVILTELDEHAAGVLGTDGGPSNG